MRVPQAVEIVQRYLDPQPTPADENRALLQKEFLKAAQAGQMHHMMNVLASHPSVLAARSTTKGYTAMHFAAMSGAVPLLVWLAENGLAPDVLSEPADGSEPVTPLHVAMEYKRMLAAERLRVLQDGRVFLRAQPQDATDEARMRAAVAAGNSAAIKVLLWRSSAIARIPALHGPDGVLMAAARGGHVPVMEQLLQHGAADVLPADALLAQQAAVVAQNAGTAALLEKFIRVSKPLQVGHSTELPGSLVDASRPLPPAGALVLDVKLSRTRWSIVDAGDTLISSCQVSSGTK